MDRSVVDMLLPLVFEVLDPKGKTRALATLVRKDLAVTTASITPGHVTLVDHEKREITARAEPREKGMKTTFLKLDEPREGVSFLDLVSPSDAELGSREWVSSMFWTPPSLTVVEADVNRSSWQVGPPMKISVSLAHLGQGSVICEGAPVLLRPIDKIVGFFLANISRNSYCESISCAEVIAYLKRNPEDPIGRTSEIKTETPKENSQQSGGNEKEKVLMILLSYFSYSESTRYILKAGLELARFSGNKVVQLSHLLAACLLVGVRRKALRTNKDYAFVFLAKALGIDGLDSFREFFSLDDENLFSSEEIDYLVNKIADNVIVKVPLPCAVSPDVDRLLKSAKDLAGQTLKRPEDTCIHQRHLLAALLLHACQHESELARLLLNRMKKSPEILGRELAGLWGGLPSDDREAWEKVFPEDDPPVSDAISRSLFVKSPTGEVLCCANLLTPTLAIAPASCIEDDDVQLFLPGVDKGFSKFTLRRKVDFVFFEFPQGTPLDLAPPVVDWEGNVPLGSETKWSSTAFKRDTETLHMVRGVGIEVRGDGRLLLSSGDYPEDVRFSAELLGSPVVSQGKVIGIVVEVNKDGSILAASAPYLSSLLPPGHAGSPPIAQSPGRGCLLRREAGEDECCLSAEEYADALAELFRSAEGEFCFALFGPWGRGKSYLMDLVGGRLRSENYEVIRFSAWKYRSTPAIWCHLYETVTKSLASMGWWKRRWTTLEVGLRREGYGPLVGAGMCFVLSILPFSVKMEAASWVTKVLLGTLGLGGAFMLLNILFQSKRFFTKVSGLYGHLPSHAEGMGLQEVIGDDLRVLLLEWIGAEPPWCWRWIRAGLCWCNRTIFRGSMSVAPVQEAVAGRRLLLVVDDLDRCEMGEMLTVVESLMLLLHDDKIQKCVQIAMLIEEDALRLALSRKYEELIRSRSSREELPTSSDRLPGTSQAMRHPVVDQNIDKLFLSYFRLDSLTGEEVSDLVCRSTDRYVRDPEPAEPKAKKDPARVPELPVRKRETPSEGKNSARQAGDQGQLPMPPKPTPESVGQSDSPGDPGMHYTPAERDELIRAILALHEEASQRGVDWGPRATRSFQFRYQLARLLYEKLEGSRPDASALLDRMKEVMLARAGGAQPSPDSALPAMDRVVRMVV